MFSVFSRVSCVITKNGTGCKYVRVMFGLTRARGMATLTIQKPIDLVDSPWDISVSGLQSGQDVTIHATTTENKMRFGSFAHFTADQSGSLDLAKTESVGGTYTGVENMGLMWSMVAASGQRSGIRLAKRDITTPVTVKLDVYENHKTETSLYEDERPQPITTQTIERWYKGADVKRSEIREGNVRGTLFTPPGDGPFPGVIDMFGTAGGNLEFRAALLASRGFTVLALPYFAYQDLPTTLVDVDFTYFLDAVSWFSSLSQVESGGVGVVGVSKGGEIGLWMAVHSPLVSGVVNISGAPYLGVCPMKFRDEELPGNSYDFSKLVVSGDAMSFREALSFEEKPLIPIHLSKAKVLILFGDDDQMNPVEHQYRYLKWLPEHKRQDVTLKVFPETGHLIEPPYMPFSRSSFHILFRNAVLWGGQMRPHAHAEVSAWNTLKDFLTQNVGQRKNKVNSQL